MRNILLTGFEGYGGRRDNPSAMVATALDGREIGGGRIAAKIFPVSFAKLPELIGEAISELDPVVVISIGLWPGEPMIRIERLAINFAEFGIPDNEGRLQAGPVVDGGPDAIAATWPAREIVGNMLDAGIPARLSEHAGTFLCNATLYWMLRAIHQRPTAPCVGFMHVPYLPTQICEAIRGIEADRTIELFQRQDVASMAFELQLQAASIAVETTMTA